MSRPKPVAGVLVGAVVLVLGGLAGCSADVAPSTTITTATSDSATATTPPAAPPATTAMVPVAPATTAAPYTAPAYTAPAYTAPATTEAAAPQQNSAGTGGTDCGTDSYINSDGQCIHDPVQAPSAPAGATAKCNDGTYSFSKHHSGTCSGHGGVAEWL